MREFIDIVERHNPQWKKSAASHSDVVVWVDVERVNASAAKDRNFHVGPNGEGGISGRYDRFNQWMERGEAVEMPEITLTDTGEISFINGRHRFAWMRDHGVDKMPVAVSGDVEDKIRELFGAE